MTGRAECSGRGVQYSYYFVCGLVCCNECMVNNRRSTIVNLFGFSTCKNVESPKKYLHNRATLYTVFYRCDGLQMKNGINMIDYALGNGWLNLRT